MADSDDPGLQARLASLQARYVLRLQQDLPCLIACAGQLQALREDVSAWRVCLEDIQRQLHKLTGSAGTFGFTALSDDSRALDVQIKAWLAQASLPDPAEQDDLVAGIQALAPQGTGGVLPKGPVPIESPAHMSPEPVTDRGAPLFIQVLDPDAEQGGQLVRALQNFGFAVSHVAQVGKLASQPAQRQPDAVIVNVSALGFACLEKLYQLWGGQVPVIVISTQISFEDCLTAVRAGAVGYFVQPVDIPSLESRLEQYFACKRGEPYRVLIVDDDLELAEHYRLVLLSVRMEARVISQPEQLLDALREFNPDVILLDVHMPLCSGPELAQIIRLNNDWLRVPIVYLSGEADEVKQVSALMQAGDEFITKPISDAALVSGVYVRAQRSRQLSDALDRDSLTGLLKHSGIKEQLDAELSRAMRTGEPLSVVMLDIDHFKSVNDTYGHAIGDNVIRALANLLRQRLRRIDSAGRYGGEEFVIILPDCTLGDAHQVLEDIGQSFADLRFVSQEGEFSVTFSAGIASTDNSQEASVLLRLADEAMYLAKAAGRNRVQSARPPPQAYGKGSPGHIPPPAI